MKANNTNDKESNKAFDENNNNNKHDDIIIKIEIITFLFIWSDRRESDPHLKLGKLTFYRWTTVAS